MKKYLFLITALLLSAVGAKSADKLTVSPVTIAPNSTAALAVMAEFESSNIVTFQFVLNLPEGVTADLSGAKLGFPGTTHTLGKNKVSETTYTFLATDSENNGAVPTGNYILAIIPLNGASTLAEGQSLDASLTEVKVAQNVDNKFVSTTLSDVSFNVLTSATTLLSEDDIVAPIPTAAAVPLTVKYTINKGEWSTICLPFEMTAEQWQSVFGADADIRRFSGYEKSGDQITAKFGNSLSGKFVACRPYLIRTTQDISSFNVTATIVEKTTRDKKLNEDEDETIAYMEGTLQAGTVVPEKHVYTRGDKFYYSDGTVLKGFRAFFWFKDEVSTSENIVMDRNVPTAINQVSTAQSDNETLYNISGQRVTKPAKNGLYIMGNKKVIVR